ncbi:phospholipase D-like domain-containing protein [Brachybacterium sacelli]|uniref:Cardiolipin synthase n=1 Tax=Brachybacterium sacelli TaxID=173364 RepID=A0ABS4X4G5_9MICO|nr:phospholipase D-like domain-containing protein [Brachybacterium sacelli]MBP2383352.1 cardiolipin synthase [Brachybacterium sacelli]
MTKPRSALLADGRRILVRSAATAAGALVGAQALVIATLVVVDGVKERGRKVRGAPRPGTFHAQVEQSQLSIYTSGATLYDDMIEAIDSARTSIQMETFIWKGDEVGQRFMDALNGAAERGVEVHVIYDGFANLVVRRSFYRQFSERIHVWRMPLVRRKFWKGIIRLSGLNHSKIMVVDHHIGFVGGYNIGAPYALRWRDTHLREIGPAVWELRNAIAQVWNEGREADDQIAWVPPRSGDPEVRVAANLPVQLVYPIRGTYLAAIERARSHIFITTPYFVPDQQILAALVKAAQRGVDVRVMLPEESNHIVADWVSRGFYGQMLDAGITILLYRAAMIHAKTATIDGRWSTVGTANIDRLSLSFNYETNVEIIDPGFAAQIEKIYKADSEHCEMLTSPDWRDRHPMARLAEVILSPLRSLL